jgi:ElaB/YqjD/DUF883 family membrane-anchored ribosome-binding protein
MSMIAEGEHLLQAAASASGESLTAARRSMERKFRHAGAALKEASQPVIDRTRRSAAAADNLVHGHPWAVAGVAIAAGVLIGFLAAKRLGD